MSNILLCQLGIHTIVLPEAFLLAPDSFTEVHAISTDNKKSNYDLLFEFFARYPQVHFTLTLLKDFEMVSSAASHEQYEETLWRWYIDKSYNKDLPTVCLSGGIKTMVASLQKAAHLFGAAEVFHVLVHPNINSLEELDARHSILDFVKMGREDGWGTLRHLCTPALAPLQPVWGGEGNIKYVSVANDFSLRQTVHDLIEATRSQTDPRPVALPFTSLVVLPKPQLQWLEQSLAWDDLPWLCSLPKTELHCHLGGFGAFGATLQEVRQADTDQQDFSRIITPPESWPLPAVPVSLDTYMQLGDNTGSTLFKNRKRLIRQIELLYEHLEKERVVYAEIRCSPDNYATPTRSAWVVLQDIQQTFQKLMDQDGSCHVNLIIIASRKEEGDMSPISRHLALAITAAQNITDDSLCRVVGVDLAGFENRATRASYFAQDFVGVHRCGLAVTAHAGENDDAEGIWQAVHALHARRIGHALHLWQAPDLLRSMADRKIAVEMCPYANYQIKGFAPMKKSDDHFFPAYPLLDYLRKGLLVTVNTDNIGISDASLSQNFQLLARLCPQLTRLEVLRIIRNGIEAAFISPHFRVQLLSKFDAMVYQACRNI